MNKITDKKKTITFLASLLLLIGASFCFSPPTLALDKIILKNKEVIEGTILGGTEDKIAIKTKKDNTLLYIDRSDVAQIISDESRSFASAQKFFEAGKYAEAITLYREATKEDSDPYWKQKALLQIGWAYIKLEDWRKAEETFRNFLKSYPDSAMLGEATFYLARTLFHQKKQAEASLLYEKFINMQGAKNLGAEAQYDIAEIYLSQEDYEQALMGYLRVMIVFYEQDSLVPKAMLRAGLCYEKLKIKERARQIYEEVVTSYPQTEYVNLAQERLTSLMEEKNAEGN